MQLCGSIREQSCRRDDAQQSKTAIDQPQGLIALGSINLDADDLGQHQSGQCQQQYLGRQGTGEPAFNHVLPRPRTDSRPPRRF